MSEFLQKFGKFCLIGLGAIVLGIAAIIIVVFTASGPATDVTETFFQTLEQDPAAAYAMTDEGFQSGTTEDDFLLFIESYPFLRSIDKMSFPNRSVENVNGETRYTLTGNLVGTDGETVSVAVFLVDDGDGIQVYGLQINPDEIPSF